MSKQRGRPIAVCDARTLGVRGGRACPSSVREKGYGIIWPARGGPRGGTELRGFEKEACFHADLQVEKVAARFEVLVVVAESDRHHQNRERYCSEFVPDHSQ